MSRLFARFLQGLLIGLITTSTLQAQEWQRMGPPGGMVLSLGVGAAGTAYLGTADGHVFAKDSPGKPWELRGRIGTRTDAVVSRVVADRSRSGVLFASIWYLQPGAGGGVFRSDDGARTWKLLGLEEEAVRALEITSAPSPIILAGSRSGVFRSIDEGRTWDRITPVNDPELRNVDSLAVDPRDSNTIYTGTYHLPWKTTDGGKSWKPVTAGLIDDSDIMSLRVDATDPERVFLSACSGIYRSENQGDQWSKLQGIPYAARRTQAIVQDLQNPQTLYAGTTEGLWVTRDGGESWERTTPKDWVINAVAILPGSSKSAERVLLGTESRGVQESEDFGKTFAEYNEGFAHEVVRQLISDPADASHLLMLMERNGAVLWESHDAGETWKPATLNREEGNRTIHFTAETIEKLYGSPWGWVVRLSSGELWIQEYGTERWQEWRVRIPAISTAKVGSPRQTSRAAVATHALQVALPKGGEIVFSKHDGYLSTQEGLLRCPQAGNCVRLKAFGSSGSSGVLQVSSDGSVLQIVSGGRLATSSDGGQTAAWVDLPVRSNNLLWLKNLDSEGIHSIFLGTTEGLFSSQDAGANWKRREQGLPAGQVEQVVEGHGFMAASLREGGMYVSEDQGTTWTRDFQDPEKSRFTGMVETSPGTLTIGTQSEGVLRWQIHSN